MIYDKLYNIGQYAFPHTGLMSCIKDIRESLSDESVDSSEFRKTIIQFTTVNKEEKRYEAHMNHIDVHIVLEGREYVEVCHIEQLTELSPYHEENDIFFGEAASDNKFKGYLEAGSFLICFPEDAHLVGAHELEEQSVRKIIYKIRV